MVWDEWDDSSLTDMTWLPCLPKLTSLRFGCFLGTQSHSRPTCLHLMPIVICHDTIMARSWKRAGWSLLLQPPPLFNLPRHHGGHCRNQRLMLLLSPLHSPDLPSVSSVSGKFLQLVPLPTISGQNCHIGATHVLTSVLLIQWIQVLFWYGSLSNLCHALE